MFKNEFETEELRQWILNDEICWNKVNNALDNFNEFVEAVKSIINSLNYCYDFLNFKIKEIDLKSLFNYFNDY